MGDTLEAIISGITSRPVQESLLRDLMTLAGPVFIELSPGDSVFSALGALASLVVEIECPDAVRMGTMRRLHHTHEYGAGWWTGAAWVF